VTASVTLVPTHFNGYAYLEGRAYENRDFIDAIFQLTPHPLRSDIICAHTVKGELNDDINRLIIAECIKLGFKELQLTRPEGHSASRHATFVETRDGLDFYTVDLLELTK